jgi:hypothetical protein
MLETILAVEEEHADDGSFLADLDKVGRRGSVDGIGTACGGRFNPSQGNRTDRRSRSLLLGAALSSPWSTREICWVDPGFLVVARDRCREMPKRNRCLSSSTRSFSRSICRTIQTQAGVEAAIDYAREPRSRTPRATRFWPPRKLGFAPISFDQLENRVKLPRAPGSTSGSRTARTVAITGTDQGLNI